MVTTTAAGEATGFTCPSIGTARRIVERLAALKSDGDIEGALAIYHPDAVLLAPPFRSRSQGSGLRGALRRFYAFAPDYRVRLDGYGLHGDTLCAWGEASLTPAMSYGGARPNGATVTTAVFILFRFQGDRVAWESFHFDAGDVARQCGLAAEDLVVAGS